MRLPKKTREAIYTAKGPVEIDWPEDAPKPRKGHRYTVQTGARAGEARIAVLSLSEAPTGELRATVRLDADPVRLLARQHGLRTPQQYTESSMGALPDDPGEAVDEDYQQRLSEEGRQKTYVIGAERRHEHKQAAMAKKLERAKARGHEKTVKTLERILRAREEQNGPEA